jgi:membrane protein YqaA with SNARE-associated domain
MEYFAQFGYVGIFLVSFLAATILPFSSEVVLGFLLLKDLNPTALISVATFGNVLGALVNYATGFWGSTFLAQRVFKIPQDDFIKAEKRFKKYGVFSLFFAWVPVIGDPLTLVAGVLRINIILFLVLVTAGKLIRYLVVGYAVLF